MTTIKIIKPWSFALLFVVLSSAPLHISAKSCSIRIKDRSTLSADANAIFNSIMSQPEIIWGNVVNVNARELALADTLYCSLDNGQVKLYATYHSGNMDYNYVHYESSDYDTHAVVSLLGNNIHIDLRTSLGKYQIISISETEAAIVRYEPNILNEKEYNDTVGYKLLSNEELGTRSVVPTSTPVIRVLFLYTSSALTLMYCPYNEFMKIEAYRYIYEGNKSFIDSDINAHLELAYLGPIDYDESSHTWDEALNHFYSQNDGYMDEVHTLRNKYSADICVLMLNKYVGLCGEAKDIKATESTAFCMILPDYSLCGWRYSAIHEIGHLIGCRHNWAQDFSPFPYIYGHGFMHCNEDYSAPSWCTIMSYENTCRDTTCQRIPYWSNPEITYTGIAIGSTLENNARVWNERASTVSAFRARDAIISLDSIDNNTDALFESYSATSVITTGNGYEVQSGQIVDMAATSQIKLTPGTHIKRGANYRAAIRSNADDSNYPQFIKRKDIPNNKEINNKRFAISPNPVNAILQIQTSEELAQVNIYNLNGQCVMQAAQTDIDVSALPQGMYILRAVTTDSTPLQAKFIKQ